MASSLRYDNATELPDGSPPRSSISLIQYEVPLVQVPELTTPAHSSSSGSSPATSSSSSPSSENSSVPSLLTHDLKTPNPVGDDEQTHFLPGEDFRFLNDPVYCEYLSKSSINADDVLGPMEKHDKLAAEIDMDLRSLVV